MRFQKDFGFIVEEYCYCLLCQQCHSGWQGHTRKEEGFVLRYFLHEKKRRKEESQHPIFFALFVHFAKWLLIYLVHVFNTLEKYAMKARFACSIFLTAMTHFCTHIIYKSLSYEGKYRTESSFVLN